MRTGLWFRSGRENHDDVWAMKGSEGLAQGEMEERP